MANPYEQGISNVVLYLDPSKGLAWQGVTSLNETPERGTRSALYLDGQVVNQSGSLDHYHSVLSAYTYPPELDAHYSFFCGLCYRTEVEGGYLLHLLYNISLHTKESAYTDLLNGSPTIFGWDLFGLSETNLGLDVFSHLIIDSRKTHDWILGPIEDILYGVDGLDAQLPDQNQILEFFEDGSILRITDHGDGTWTAEGPDEAITMIDEVTFELTWPSVVKFTGSPTFEVSSL